MCAVIGLAGRTLSGGDPVKRWRPRNRRTHRQNRRTRTSGIKPGRSSSRRVRHTWCRLPAR
ncbi:MAG: hypothetical protein MZV70_08040 [Desulfobacterales bacterium]|nr:hypothetical protein [Desulfobacterales bacterium]